MSVYGALACARSGPPDKLVAAWTLVDGDWPPMADKTGATRLGFTVLLWFCGIEARFPPARGGGAAGGGGLRG